MRTPHRGPSAGGRRRRPMIPAGPTVPAAPLSLLTGLDALLEDSNLSARQLLIYTGQQLHAGKVVYDAVYAIRWPQLQPERFAAAWRALVAGCDALRIVLEERNGVPYQRTLATARTHVECVDLRAEPEPVQAVDAWIAERLRQPMVLSERLFDTAL